MKQVLILLMIFGVSGCGGANRFGGDVRAVRPMASGPISDACLQSDRKARSRALCGCIQAVANDTLSGRDQRRAVSFYRDPHAAQEIRQSDRPGDERFWRVYTAYAEQAERVCA